jgi:hypothetical protein
MSAPKAPSGLQAGGRSLWKAITEAHELDAAQLVQLTEACRQKDRLDEMDRIIHGKGVLELMRFRVGDIFHSDDEKRVNVVVKFDAVIDRANATANAMKQLLAALRLPDEQTGKRPQYRGPRGAVAPQQPGGASKVSSLDRARAAKSS